MNCKVRRVLGFVIFCAVAYICMTLIPEASAGYVVMVGIIGLGSAIAFFWLVNALGRMFRNPYTGAAELRRRARKEAVDKGIDLDVAATLLFMEAQQNGQTTPKAQPAPVARPALQEGRELKAHLQEIRGHGGIPKAGYDQPAQKPALPAPLTWDELATAWMDEKARKSLDN